MHNTEVAQPTDEVPRVAARAAEREVIESLTSRSPELSCVIVLGAPGTGVRNLIARRIPALLPEARLLEDQWPTAAEPAAVAVFATAEHVPAAAPVAPADGTGLRVLIGCHSLAALPRWVRQLAPAQRKLVRLRELGHVELQRFLQARLGGHVTGSTLRALGSSAGFMPSVLAPIVRILRQEGILVEADGSWTLSSPITADLFTTHLDNILASFDTATREQFLRICVVGSIERRTASTVTLERLESLASAGLVDATDGHRFAIRSRTLAEAGQLLIDPATAERIANTASTRKRVHEFTVLWRLQHANVVDSAAVRQVIDEALHRHDWSGADHLAALAIERLSDGQNTDEDARDIAALLVSRARAARFSDEPDEALASLAQAESMLVDGDDETAELRSRVAAHKAQLLHYKSGDLDAAMATLQAAVTAATLPAARYDLTAEQVLHLTYGGHFRAAAELESSITAQLHHLTVDQRVRLSIARCLRLVAEGQMQQAFTVALRIGARHLLTPTRRQWITEEISSAYFISTFRLHGPTQQPALMRRFMRQTAREFRPDDTTFQLARSAQLLVAGRLTEAVDMLTACHANVQFHDPAGLAQAVAAMCAHAAALQGDAQTARHMLTAAAVLPARSSAVIGGGVAANLSMTEQLLGSPQAADRTLQRGADFAAAGSFGFAAEVLHAGVRFGDAAAACALSELRDHLEGPLARLHLDHAEALLARDPVALSEVADRYQQAGLPVHAAEAYALVLRQEAVPELTQRRTEHELQLLRPLLAGFAHPLLRQHTAATAQLSKREQEVQELILKGLSNREIAARLHLSPRTVEGHVARLYRKTGHRRRDPHRRG